ncbi:MAG: glycerol kinase GlpK [Actinomycetota bacterium]|nr:glycerol kinase GlpK [Actinomycetota bacterium]
MDHVLGIDAGTTGVTALVVDESGAVKGRGYREFPQSFPRPGWVEHDPDDWWRAMGEGIVEALSHAGVESHTLAAVGLTNQRETTVAWDPETLRPVHPAIVWQDRRTADLCDRLREEGWEDRIRERTGLVIDPYFSGTKLAWLLEHVPGLRVAAESGRAVFGTVDSYILARLTGGGVHATDATNASRTMLYDIRKLRWDGEILERLGIPEAMLPEVRPSSGRFGVTAPDRFFGAGVPVSGIAGDQQAALFGQACFTPGSTKNTYGTGSFVLMNTGDRAPASESGLLTTIAYGGDGFVEYALEGSIFVTGAAVQWLRDGLGLIASSEEIGPLAASVPDTGDVYFVPALVGLGAPHWDPYARGTIVGVTRGTTRAHLARAAVEAMAYQTRDVVEAMRRDAGLPLTELKADGGASVMDLLMQFQADLLGVPVRRPEIRETTALGATYLAGLGEGVWSSREEVADHWRLDREFVPSGDAEERYARWRLAVERSLRWAST